MIRPCSGLDSKKSWQGGDNDEEHAMSHRLGSTIALSRRSEEFCNTFPSKEDIQAEHSGQNF
jgi:hypothetical protein